MEAVHLCERMSENCTETNCYNLETKCANLPAVRKTCAGSDVFMRAESPSDLYDTAEYQDTLTDDDAAVAVESNSEVDAILVSEHARFQKDVAPEEASNRVELLTAMDQAYARAGHCDAAKAIRSVVLEETSIAQSTIACSRLAYARREQVALYVAHGHSVQHPQLGVAPCGSARVAQHEGAAVVAAAD
ncbi:hypothetical protein CYMTET_4026 [Cymbomonas tetramitiformis]|uniref:Uncharacterized protein n=1 Tax=Cymbomonas tetramitiformis TaxID=36881 RepID=A0AAE0H3U9_9CHLO|nr:hypothetical protein CYMTET_33479 [Cymbomonas tetramitiformis]KAK3288501.1 hypothetical protein CYMTET_4026 [Cymbomonas tetramitiformis]